MRLTNLTRANEIGANAYLVEVEGRCVLLDCGMHPTREALEATPLLERVERLDAVVLTHAHQDHVGCLPLIQRRFARAPVFMTRATAALADVMLHNSVNVMGRKRVALDRPEYPLFTHCEVAQVSGTWHTLPLHRPFTLRGERAGEADAAEPMVTLHDAGHILGSAAVTLSAGGRSLLYTGDLNPEDQTLIPGAELPEGPVDVLLLETTRGDSPTPEGWTRAAEERRFVEALGIALRRGGAVLVPVFALGKTQEILAILHRARQAGTLPECPLYIGGLGTKFTIEHDELSHHTPRLAPGLDLLKTVRPFTLAGDEAARTPVDRPRIYAVSSGMMTPETVSNRLAQRMLSDPACSILFVGYADPDSPAGKLIAAGPGGRVQLSPDAAEQEIRCSVESFSLSAHGRREALLDLACRLRPGRVVLVHGDPPALEWFRAQLAERLPGTPVVIPPPGETIEV